MVETLCLKGVGVLDTSVVHGHENVPLFTLRRGNLIERQYVAERIRGWYRSSVIAESGVSVAANCPYQIAHCQLVEVVERHCRGGGTCAENLCGGKPGVRLR